jgi:hypothetical protein
MSNTRRLPPGTVPAALSRDGKEVPPSADVAEHNLAQIIGQAVALYLGELLAPLLTGLAGQRRNHVCLRCAADAKRADREHEIAVANAKAAAEELPDAPDIKLNESFTDGARGPVCWQHFDPERDGIFDFDGILPPAVD